ncbi:MAG: hypothetical protein K2P99_05335 [Burkholderiales bacterium]|nr:hypothetical protein [Burkholderiales bacterium]
MKKLFVLVIIAIVVLYTSLFTVENNQVAIKVNQYNGNTIMYTKGVYFYVPMLDMITYFDTNTKTNILVTTVRLYSSQNKGLDAQQNWNLNIDEYRTSFLVSWHISYPMQYYIKYQESSTNLLTQIKQEANTIIEQATRDNQTANKFNLLNNILQKPIYMDKLGISIDNISLLQLIPNLRSLESISIQNESSTNLLGAMDKSQIESAYYIANDIIADTTVKKAKLYQSIDSTDEKFYNYYRKLAIYKHKAKSLADFPAFNKLYP